MAPLWFLIILCAGIEAVLLCSDFALLDLPRLRSVVYDYGGFWPGLLDDWIPNYPSQPWVMFLSYGFLHAGPSHLIVNMLTLWSVGRVVVERVGVFGFFALYTAALIGGAGGFALLASGVRPMVGASGALFGLVGGVLAWTYLDLFVNDRRLWPVVQSVAMLVGLNLVLWWAMSGQLAWEAHLGGFLAGWLVALLIDPRAQPLGRADG